MPRKTLASAFFLALCVFSNVGTSSATTEIDFKEASRQPRWLRLYQYEKSGSGYVSAVTSERFFFSPRGRRDPETELASAIEAYSDPTRKFGTQSESAACVFPARKLALEKILDRKFPSPSCPDLENWVSRIGADRASLVFVGAYPGNPASILGHSFLRLSNRARESSGREGLDLLSYSIGFMAQADPRDNRMIYMLKGLTGGYPGFYEIEPHYMKVGLYNNSESRDLWDLPLDLTTDEVDTLVRHYWELTFNASLDYYFIDENCSYRLLTLIEAVKPEVDLTSKLSMVVLPAETVRAAIDAGLAHETPRFRPSVKRRMEYKLSLLSDESIKDFKRARRSADATRTLEDPTAVDALLDHWLYENYKVKTQLDDESKTLMEETYKRASQLRTPSLFQNVTNEKIRSDEALSPPFFGHKPSWLELRGGSTSKAGFGGVTYRAGAHPFWSGDESYDEISGIEYLGFDVSFAGEEKSRWNLLLAKATAYENFFAIGGALSWSFEGHLENGCQLCATEAATPLIDAGIGIGSKTREATLYLLAHGRAASWLEDGAQGMLSPGLAAGFKLRRGSFTFSLESQVHWWREQRELETKTRLALAASRDLSAFLDGRSLALSPSYNRSEISVGLAHFF